MKIPFFEGYSSDISILKKESLFISLIYLKTLKKYFTRKTAFISLPPVTLSLFFFQTPSSTVRIHKHIKVHQRKKKSNIGFPVSVTFSSIVYDVAESC